MKKIVLAINTLKISLIASGTLQADIDILVDNLSVEMNASIRPFIIGVEGPLKYVIDNTDLLTSEQKSQFIIDIT